MQELIARLGTFFEYSPDGTGYHTRILFLYSTRSHAEVNSLADYIDTFRTKLIH